MNEQCPLCQSTGDTVRGEIIGSETFTLYSCRQCGLWYWSPRQLDSSHYESGQFFGSVLMHAGESYGAYTEPFFSSFPLATGRLLDVGCGDGRFIERAMGRGFHCVGIEIDRKAVAAAKALRGLDCVRSASLRDISQSEQPFDAVTIFEVLEHQEDPIDFLRGLKDVLRAGGWIAGSVPNRRGAFNNFERSYFFDSILPPHHYLWFDRNSLHLALSEAGYQEISIRPSHFLSVEDIAWVMQARVFQRPLRRVKKWVTTRSTSGPGADDMRILARRARLLKSLRHAAAAPLIPPAWLARNSYNREPQGLYFQARSVGEA